MSILSIPTGSRWRKDPEPSEPPSEPLQVFNYYIAAGSASGEMVSLHIEMNVDPSRATPQQIVDAINASNKGVIASLRNNHISLEHKHVATVPDYVPLDVEIVASRHDEKPLRLCEDTTNHPRPTHQDPPYWTVSKPKKFHNHGYHGRRR